MGLAGSVGCIRGRAQAKLRVPEAAVLRGVLQLLALDKRVAWHQRMNVGAMESQGRFVRFGFPGLTDIIGQMVDGRFLAIECKASDGKLTPAQVEFLRVVHAAGGVSGMVRSVDEAQRLLDG